MSHHRIRINLKTICLSLLFLAPQISYAVDIKADIYVDNWFALYQEGELIKEDSVPFKTERSFNTESFTFSTELPAQFSIIIRDYYENDSGLEYIGGRRQQMGDGGFVAQFFNADTNELIDVSDSSWSCLVTHRAPLNRSCVRDDNPEQTCESEINEAPEGWMLSSFDDSAWSPAIEWAFNAVRPHGGYRDAQWRDEAKIIWSEDLEVDNELLCRFTIEAA